MPIPESGHAPAHREGGGELSVEAGRAGDSVILGLEGELDLHTVALFRHHLAEAVATAECAVLVDLRGVTFIDSTGLSTLLNALRRLTRARKRLLLVVGKGSVLRMLQLTRLEETFALYRSPGEALAAVEDPAASAAA
jgi:anti-anti-sigma factor